MSRQPAAIRGGNDISVLQGGDHSSLREGNHSSSLREDNHSSSLQETNTSPREDNHASIQKNHRLQPPPQNTPNVSSRRRKLRLVRNQLKKDRSFHIASVDDYDDTNADVQKEAILFPFLTYDPGLLDTAVILVATSRTQNVFVGCVAVISCRRRKVRICSCSHSAICGSNAFSPLWRNWFTCRSVR